METRLNVMASLSNTGYGIASKYLIKEMFKQKYNITLFGHGDTGGFDTQEESEFFRSLIRKKEQEGGFDTHAPCLNIWHQFDLFKRIGIGPYIGYPIFELTHFNQQELNGLSVPDSLFVTSEWAKEIVVRETRRPANQVEVVPLGVDSRVFNPESRTQDDTYRFINLGKWEKRKGHDFIAEVFSKAFTNADNVELHMYPYNPFLHPPEVNEWMNRVTNTALGHKVKVHAPCITHHQLAQQIKKCDCGVFPSRAEGWNMELLECMACGLATIATDYSAHTEYCNDDNCFLIKGNRLEAAHDGKWFFGQGEWLEFDYEEEEQLIEHMRYCYNNRITTNTAGLETAKKFSWENSVECITNHLTEGVLAL